MNMDACLPGHEAATAATAARTGREREQHGGETRNEEETEAASRIKNAITILKNGPGNVTEAPPKVPCLRTPNLAFLD